MQMKVGKLFLISAPSGAGKTSLVKKLLSTIGKEYNLKRVITYTTRLPRSTEVNGKDYCFISTQMFCNLQSKNYFLESSSVYGALYGTPRFICDHLKKGISYIIVVDRFGAEQIKKKITATAIWIYTKNEDILRSRLEKRGENTEEQIKKRLFLAQKEIKKESHCSLYDYHILNDNFNEAVFKLQSIITDIIGL